MGAVEIDKLFWEGKHIKRITPPIRLMYDRVR